MVTNATLTREIARRVADRGLLLARPATGSRTLSASMAVEDGVSSELISKRFIRVPQYWAVFKHDGTGIYGPRGTPIRPKKSTGFLVWYRDPSLDPRYTLYPPVRLTQYNPPLKLSPADFRALKQAGEIFLAKSSRGMRPTYFFDNQRNMKPLLAFAGETAKKLTREAILDDLGTLSFSDKATATF